MGEAAVRAARSAGYFNAGTVEFLVDASRNFYFLEMNTRLQVEHPVTELVTGLDLVRLQLEIAAGEPLGLAQEAVEWRGAAMECRIYAEDPENNFVPSPGMITHFDQPSGPGIRLDSGVYAGWTVPLDYDPLLAKLAVWAPSREAAIARMRRALSEMTIQGIRTNSAFFQEILDDEVFRRGALSTSFLEEFFRRRGASPQPDGEMEAVAAVVAALQIPRADAWGLLSRSTNGAASGRRSMWIASGREEMLR